MDNERKPQNFTSLLLQLLSIKFVPLQRFEFCSHFPILCTTEFNIYEFAGFLANTTNLLQKYKDHHFSLTRECNFVGKERL